MIAVFINGVIALLYLRTLSAADKDSMVSLVSHAATLPMNAMLLLIGASWMYRKGSSWSRRVVLPFMAVPVFIAYIVSQRRAAIVALVVGIIMIFIVMLWTKRRLFWRVAPVTLVIVTLYTGAFWGDETSTAGFPAQAIKSVIAPDSVSERNQSSDDYRIAEKIDIVATIRSSTILGIGFGHPFLRPVPLPDITPFLLEPYMPHNSILWIWMKAGIGGFVAMLFLFAMAVKTGARAHPPLPGG